MAKVNLLRFFKAFSNSPHHIAAVNMLQDAIDPELLHRNADWIICFEAENESDPQTAIYNI